MKVHIGEEIKKKADELKIGTTELGKLINTSKQNVYGIYQRSSIDVEQLYQLSKVLKFNFFHLYELPEMQSSKLRKECDMLKKENDRLKSDVKTLTEKNELLQKINKLLEKKK